MKSSTLIMFTLFTSILWSPLIMAKATAWSCGDWKKDPKGKCEEIQTCTRTVCSTKGKIEGCQTETKTNCANPIPPTTTKPSAFIKANPITSSPKAIKTTPKPRPKPKLGAGSLKLQQPAILAPVGLPPVPVQKKSPVNPRVIPNQQPNNLQKKPTFAPYTGVEQKKFRKIETPNAGNKVFTPEIRNPALEKIKRNQLKVPGNAGFVGEEIKEVAIDNSVIKNIIQSIFQGTQIRFNNYGPRHGNTWYKGNDSLIRLPSTLGGAGENFTVNAVNEFPHRFYINDINSNSVKVIQAFQSPYNVWAIKFSFETDIKELKGHCATNNYILKLDCVSGGGSDAATPDFNLTVEASINLAFSVRNETLSYRVVNSNVSFDAAYKCPKNGHRHCSMFGNYRVKMKTGFNTTVKSLLNSETAKEKFENIMRSELKKHGINKVINLDFKNIQFVFRFRS